MQVNAFVVELGVRHWVENKGISIEEGTEMVKSVQVRSKKPHSRTPWILTKALDFLAIDRSGVAPAASANVDKPLFSMPYREDVDHSF